MVIEGVATTIPADLAILKHPDFAAFQHSTKWVETVLDLKDVSSKPAKAPEPVEGEEPKVRRDVDVEVNGKKFSVSMWVPESAGAPAASGGAAKPKPRRAASGGASAAAASGSLTAPMQGTIVKVTVAEGDEVAEGDTICVLEAMKMENAITADKAGKVAKLNVEAGQSVGSGDVLAVIE